MTEQMRKIQFYNRQIMLTPKGPIRDEWIRIKREYEKALNGELSA